MPFFIFTFTTIMSLLEKIKNQLNVARNATPRNNALVSLLITFYSESAMVGKNKGNRETTDEEVVAVAKRFIDGMNTIKAASKDRQEVIYACEFEISVLNEYIPKQLTEDELRSKVTYLMGATPNISMGEIMKHFKTNWAGRYDGGLLSKIVKERMN